MTHYINNKNNNNYVTDHVLFINTILVFPFVFLNLQCVLLCF